MKSLSEHLYDKYNSYNRRPTAFDPAAKSKMFNALDRSLGKWLPLDKHAVILDVACGEGTLLLFLQQKGYTNLRGFDLSPENVGICHQLGLGFVQIFDAMEIPDFSPETRFDFVLLIDIVEHMPKNKILGFLRNVVKRINPGGAVVIQTPNMGSLFASHILHNDLSHEFGLTEKTAMDLLTMLDLDIDEIDIVPSWNATSPLGYLREFYLQLLHFVVFVAADSARPRIPTKNLLIKAVIK